VATDCRFFMLCTVCREQTARRAVAVTSQDLAAGAAVWNFKAVLDTCGAGLNDDLKN